LDFTDFDISICTLSISVNPYFCIILKSIKSVMLTFSKLLAKTKKKDRAERERGRVKGASAEG